MNELTNNTTAQETDPLAQFTQGGAADQGQKYQFAGREFGSREEAERWAADQWAAQQAEIERLKGASQAVQQVAATVQQQPARSQYVTGQEGVAWDHAKFLRELAEDPKAIDKVMKYRMFNNPDAPYDPFDLIKASVAETARLRQQLDVLNLKSNHPEIPWNNPQAVAMIEQAKQATGGSYEGAIAILQRDGQLPTRQQWQAQFIPAVQPQQQNTPAAASTPSAPPMMGRPMGAASNSLDENALLAKINDPNTSIEEGDRLIAAWQARVAASNNPSAGGY